MKLTRLLKIVFLLLAPLTFLGGEGACAIELPSVEITEGADAQSLQEEFDFAMVVDRTDWPSDAAAIEVRPLKNMLDKVRIGGSEKTLRPLGSFGFSHKKLLDTPEKFRGQIVFAHGLIVQLERVKRPATRQKGGEILYRGVLASLRMRRGRPMINYWAFYALRRRNDAPLYAGDRVNLSGYFFKRTPLCDAKMQIHWMPLIIAPWPSYPIKRTTSAKHSKKTLPNWIPITLAVKQVGLEGLLPFTELPHLEVWSRLIIDFELGRVVGVDGVECERSVAIDELRRYLRSDPNRIVVLRRDAETTGETLRELMLEAGVVRAVKQVCENSGR